VPVWRHILRDAWDVRWSGSWLPISASRWQNLCNRLIFSAPNFLSAEFECDQNPAGQLPVIIRERGAFTDETEHWRNCF